MRINFSACCLKCACKLLGALQRHFGSSLERWWLMAGVVSPHSACGERRAALLGERKEKEAARIRAERKRATQTSFRTKGPRWKYYPPNNTTWARCKIKCQLMWRKLNHFVRGSKGPLLCSCVAFRNWFPSPAVRWQTPLSYTLLISRRTNCLADEAGIKSGTLLKRTLWISALFLHQKKKEP